MNIVIKQASLLAEMAAKCMPEKYDEVILIFKGRDMPSVSQVGDSELRDCVLLQNIRYKIQGMTGPSLDANIKVSMASMPEIQKKRKLPHGKEKKKVV